MGPSPHPAPTLLIFPTTKHTRKMTLSKLIKPELIIKLESSKPLRL
jgi:hypothetical protein